jgi:hypothetical protein
MCYKTGHFYLLLTANFIGMCRESPVPKAFGIGGDESARNEISILIAGMPRAVHGEHQCSWKRCV